MRILVITMLDLEKEQNQRTHHVIDMARDLADEVTVVYRVRSLERSLRRFIGDIVTLRVLDEQQRNFRRISIDPLFNYAQAMASGLVQSDLSRKPGLFRRLVSGILSLAGTLRDIFLIPSMCLPLKKRLREPFDICIAEGPWSMTVACWLRRRGIVHRLIYDDIDFVAGGQSLRFRYAYVAWLEKMMARRADAVVSVGWKLADFREGSSGRNAIVVPNGVKPERFARAHVKTPHPPTLVYVGNIAHYAGLDLAIDALPAIRAAVPECRVLIVGPGDPPYVEGLRKLAKRLDVVDAVDFRGPVAYERVPEVLAESDIGLATFRSTPLGDYAFPLKVVEYMAAGLPFLCTQGSESTNIIERVGGGQAIAFKASAFASAVVEIMQDSDRVEAMRTAGQAGVDRFTWQKTMRDLRGVVVSYAS